MLCKVSCAFPSHVRLRACRDDDDDLNNTERGCVQGVTRSSQEESC